MSIVSSSQPAQPPSDEPDPYRYGWRYVRVEQPDGGVDFDQVPLTLEDVLFPEVGDFIVQSTPHNRDVVYLKDVSESRLADDPHAEVVSDCRVDWNLAGVRPLGPDIAAFRGLEERRNWSTLDVAAEGARPLLVVEVTSPETRNNDLEVKLEYYHRAKVPLYVIVDAVEDDDQVRRLELIAYCYAPRHYVKIRPDARGWIWLEPIGVWVGVTVDLRTGLERVACYDDRGQEIGDYTAVSQALAVETEARVRAEELAAAEALRAVTAAQRATAEAQRAVVEVEARLHAEGFAAAEAQARVRAEKLAAAEAQRAAVEVEARLHAEGFAAAEAQARIHAEKLAAAEAQARLRAEERATAEAEARLRAEERIRELEAALRRGPGP